MAVELDFFFNDLKKNQLSTATYGIIKKIFLKDFP